MKNKRKAKRIKEKSKPLTRSEYVAKYAQHPKVSVLMDKNTVFSKKVQECYMISGKRYFGPSAIYSQHNQTGMPNEEIIIVVVQNKCWAYVHNKLRGKQDIEDYML